jgi:hypothetical protein
MNQFESFYLKLPIAMQHLFCSLEGWRIQHSRFDKHFQTFLNKAKSRTFWDQEKI